MKDKLLIAFALALVIPMLFGNFWLFAVTGYIAETLVETAAEPLLDKFLNSIAPE